jgi:hypothetical protein
MIKNKYSDSGGLKMRWTHFILLVCGLIVFGCSNTKDTYKEFRKAEEQVPFPHPDNWYLKENHGMTALNLGKSSCSAEICHGADLTGGGSGISCYMCHSTYPHETGWAYGDRHWQKVLEVGKEQCSGCHGEDFSGGDTGVSCYSCHELYPHQEGWSLNHKIYLKGVNYNTLNCATSCHGTDLNGGNSNVSCLSCHTSFPHPPDWSGWETTGHGLYLKTYNWDTSRCVDCHGQDLTGGSAGVSCYSCHSTYPHPPDNLWLTRGEVQFHGNVVNSAGSPSVCEQCHGTDYLGKNSGVSCFSCHTLYPHEINWASYTHGDYVNANGDSGCISCHDDLRSSFSLDPVSFPNCQYCH